MKRETHTDRLKKKNQVNTKAIYWIGGILGALIISLGVLIALNV